jgi:hypothetical protein
VSRRDESGDCRVLEDRYGDWHLAVRRCERPKERTQGVGGSRQKLAFAGGRLTRCAIPALHKAHSRKVPGKTTGNGITGRNRRLELRLGSKKTLYENLEQTPELEAVKRAVGISSGLRKVSHCALWRIRRLRKRKKRLQKYSPWER